MPFKMGGWEIILILVVVLIIFGVGKLPQVGGAIGKSLREFRKGRTGEEDEEKSKDTAKSSESESKAKS